MKYFKSQQGFALILVLFIIIIIAIIAPPLVTSVTSSMKQNNITEERNQVLKTSEMGQKYFQQYVKKIEKQLQEKLDSQLDTIVKNIESSCTDSKTVDCNELKVESLKSTTETLTKSYGNKFLVDFFTSEVNYDEDSSNNVPPNSLFHGVNVPDLKFPLKADNTFIISFKDIDNTISINPILDLDNGKALIEINYPSIATKGTGGKEVTTNQSTINLYPTLEKYLNNRTLPPIFACFTNSNPYTVIHNGDYVVNGDWQLKNNDNILIKGKLIVKGEIKLKNKTRITVEGSAEINSVSDVGADKFNFICVNGEIIYGTPTQLVK